MAEKTNGQEANHPIDNTSDNQNVEGLKNPKRRLTAILLGTAAAGGVLSLMGWEAQAHGNRSQHTGVGVRSSKQQKKKK